MPLMQQVERLNLELTRLGRASRVSRVSRIGGMSRKALDFVELTKPRVILMVLVTTSVGFHLGSLGMPNWGRMFQTLVGTALAAAGTLALNQYLERDTDAKMERTRFRPLPAGRIQPTAALIFGVILASAGMLYLTLRVNALSGFVIAIITSSYLFLYTPLKRKTSLCSLVGAIPGALPPVVGWVAARDKFSFEVWSLFAILFLWQLPHSLAIAWLYRNDYAQAGMRLLPVVNPDGRSTGRQIVNNCLALIAVSLLPTLIGVAGSIYFFSALALGLALFGCGLAFAASRSIASARRLFLASLVYLPLALLLMTIDKAI